MGRKKKRTRHNQVAGGGTQRARWSGRLWLVLVDDAPLRRDAANACRRRFAKLTEARDQWSAFERHDRPAFERWRAATFGAQLTELREITERLADYARLFLEVETEAFFTNCSARTAYQRIMRKRRQAEQETASPPPARDEYSDPRFHSADQSADDFKDGQDFVDEMLKEELFRDFVRKALGINPDRLADDAYEAMFETFKAEIGDRSGPDSRERTPFSRTGHAAAAPKPARLKTLYRELVRRLHPDTRGESNLHIMQLWHEVQDAYAHEDLERMETLQALTDIYEEKIGAQTALSRLRAALGEIERGLRTLSKSLRAARKHPAWKFSQLGAQPALRARIERGIFHELESLKRELEEKQALIACWERPAVKKKKRAQPVMDPERMKYTEQTWMSF